MRPARIALSVLALSTMCSCAEPVTQLIVVVDSDLMNPSEYNGVKITAIGPEGTGEFARDMFPMGEPVHTVTATLFPLLDSYEPLTITVRAEGAGMNYPPREIETRWIGGESRVLEVYLSRSCLDVVCSDVLTCIDGACMSRAVDPATLPEWDGADPATR